MYLGFKNLQIFPPLEIIDKMQFFRLVMILRELIFRASTRKKNCTNRALIAHKLMFVTSLFWSLLSHLQNMSNICEFCRTQVNSNLQFRSKIACAKCISRNARATITSLEKLVESSSLKVTKLLLLNLKCFWMLQIDK